MLPVFVVGFVMVTGSMVVSVLSFFGLESWLARSLPWFTRAPHAPRLIAMMSATIAVSLAMVIFNVWAWAWCYKALGIFDNISDALYFSIVAFTTLGLNDIAMPQEWRLLGGITAVNGFIYIGMISAMILDMVRRVRLAQDAAAKAAAKPALPT
ncbi:hypothetical protein PSAL_022200 [Pseudooceanicola algae]|uniref:Potassium channel domain-containing protein n=2 Tax=Pseudooceanicola algae TaxID=1537215 RepID=A0A418SKT0_9RHOB|nr:hypothetical protein PSAL_022200 [Pseudooceanicola algae]